MCVPEEILGAIEMSWIRQLRPKLNYQGTFLDKPVYFDPPRPRGRPPKGSDYVPRERGSYRFPPEILIAIERTAKRQKMSRNAYAEKAIRQQLAADGVRI
jgi:hypothetical protein